MKTIGSFRGKKIAIVGCVHGDEIIGKKVIGELGKITNIHGSIALIIAHPKAMQKKSVFLKKI